MNKLSKIWTGAVAYVALIIGAGLSITFNVVDVTEQRGAQLDRWDVLTAVAFPVLVVLMVEMFVSRLWLGQPWPMQLLRWAGTISIGGIAMRVSWTHGHDFFVSRGQTADVANLGPLSIDLLAIMATALILSGRTGRMSVSEDKPADITTDTLPDGTRVDIVNGQVAAIGREDTDKPAGQDTPAPWSRTFLTDTGRTEDITDAVQAGAGQVPGHLAPDIEAIREFQAKMAAMDSAPDYVPEDMVREYGGPNPPEILPERKRQPKIDPRDAAISLEFWRKADPTLTEAEIDRKVAEALGCSAKTIYRIRIRLQDPS